MDRLFPEPGRRTQMDERLTALGAAEGIGFHLDAIAMRPNTNAAHRVILWAGPDGGALAEAVMRAYFTQGRDIGDPSVLADLASGFGLDPADIRSRLASGQDRQAVDEQCRAAARAGVTGVPFTIIDNRVALSGAEEPARILMAVEKALELRARVQ